MRKVGLETILSANNNLEVSVQTVFKAAAIAVFGATLVAGCTDNQGVNAATGALAGAAVGSQLGSGSGTTAATLAGAAIGATVGANACGGQNQPPCS